MLFDETVTGLVAAARRDTVDQQLVRSAARYPHKLAVSDGDTQLTFSELDTLATQFANMLADTGVGVGDRVAIVSRNCWEFVVVVYGAARAGAMLVPLNFMLTAREFAGLLVGSTPKVLLAQTAFTGVAKAAVVQADGVDPQLIEITDAPRAEPGWLDFGAALGSGSTAFPSAVTGPDTPIRIMYTSGTESKPKGVVHSNHSLISQYLSCAVDGGMVHDDVELHSLPIFHAAQLDAFVGPDIMLGTTSHLIAAPEPATVLRMIEEHAITKFFAPPTVWISLLNSPDFDRTDLSSLAKGYYGAAAMPIEVLRAMQERLPNLQLRNFYGQTELAPVATVLQPHEQLSHAGSAGYPVLNVETRVIDDASADMPVGEVGEIVQRSPHVTLGYWNEPEITAAAFRHGWFHTGDLGAFDQEGRLRIVDRSKDMIKTGGENVSSREVEEVLYEHPSVEECAVFATPHPKWIETVTAAVVLAPNATLDQEELIKHARERLAPFKLPTVVHFVEILPKSSTGKILKRDLREQFGSQTVTSF